MSRSSGRGQVDPLPALVAAAAVALGLSAYAGVLDASLGPSGDVDADAALEEVRDAATVNGAVRPERLERGPLGTPDGRLVNVTLATAGRAWTAGPTPPAGAARATGRVAVTIDPGQVRPGQLRVVVW